MGKDRNVEMWDNFIGQQIRRCNRNLLISNIVLVGTVSQPSRLRIPVRLVRPVLRIPAGGQMLVGDQFLQMRDVFIASHTSVLNEPAVPSTVQVAWMPPALS